MRKLPGLRCHPSLGRATSRCANQLLSRETVRELDTPLSRTAWNRIPLLDYHVPVGELREEFFRYVETHPGWDKRVKSLVVTDAKETSIQIRALVSAADPDKLWTLRCDVREALISYVQEKHRIHLVRTRVSVQASSPQALNEPAFNNRAKRTDGSANSM
jgi:hypothetical protein